MPVKISPEAFVKKDYRNTNLAYKKKCVECGCVYYAKHDRSLYCSRQCNNIFSRRRRMSAMGTKMAQGGIATKALTTGIKHVPGNTSNNKLSGKNKANAEALIKEDGSISDAGKASIMDVRNSVTKRAAVRHDITKMDSPATPLQRISTATRDGFYP